MKRIYKILEKATSMLFVGQKFILLLLSVEIVGITVVDIFLRLTIKTGFAWAQEACIAIFMTLIFLGANISIKTNGEIKIDLLRFKNETAQLVLQSFINLVSLCAIAYLFRSSAASVRNAFEKPQLLATIPFSYATLYLAMPIGFSLMFLDKLTASLRYIFDRDLSDQLKRESDELENSDK